MPVLEEAADVDQIVDTLVPDPQVAKEFNVTLMTLWRWTHDPRLGFPPPVKIQNRNYRSRRGLEKFKLNLVSEAIRAREADSETTA
jgi:hypothetical protein